MPRIIRQRKNRNRPRADSHAWLTERACSAVPDRFGSLPRLFVQALSQLLRQTWRRRFFDDLLVATLDGAVSLEKGEMIAVRVRKDLNLDVCGSAIC